MDSERSPLAAYDLLLNAMKDIEVWSEDEQCWLPKRWMIGARVVLAPNVVLSDGGREVKPKE